MSTDVGPSEVNNAFHTRRICRASYKAGSLQLVYQGKEEEVEGQGGGAKRARPEVGF